MNSGRASWVDAIIVRSSARPSSWRSSRRASSAVACVAKSMNWNPRIPLNLVLLKGVEVRGFQFIDFATHATAELARNEAELMALLEAGRATPHIGATFTLDETAEALATVGRGEAVGKVVIDVAGPGGTTQ